MQSNKYLITGKSGTGKTTYFSRFVRSVPYDFVFIFDHEGEFAHKFGVEPSLTFEDIDRNAENGFVCFDPQIEFPGEVFDAFDFFADYVFQFSQRVEGTKLFNCDEFQQFSNTMQFSWELSRIIEAGRRYGIDCLFVSQQLNLIHNRARNQLTEVVTFQNTDSRALQVLEELGFDPEEVSTLAPFHFILRSLRTGVVKRGIVSPDSINETQGQELIRQDYPEPEEIEESEIGTEPA